jgi:hypothetical protein
MQQLNMNTNLKSNPKIFVKPKNPMELGHVFTGIYLHK